MLHNFAGIVKIIGELGVLCILVVNITGPFAHVIAMCHGHVISCQTLYSLRLLYGLYCEKYEHKQFDSGESFVRLDLASASYLVI